MAKFQKNFFRFYSSIMGVWLGINLYLKASGSGHDPRRQVLQRPGNVCYNGRGLRVCGHHTGTLNHYVRVDTTRQHIKKGAHTATTAMHATLQAAKERFAALITLSPLLIIAIMRGKVNAKQRGHSGLLPLCASFILPGNGGK